MTFSIEIFNLLPYYQNIYVKKNTYNGICSGGTKNNQSPLSKIAKKQAQQERKHKCINFFEVLFGIMFIYLFINKYDVNLKL